MFLAIYNYWFTFNVSLMGVLRSNYRSRFIQYDHSITDLSYKDGIEDDWYNDEGNIHYTLNSTAPPVDLENFPLGSHGLSFLIGCSVL